MWHGTQQECLIRPAIRRESNLLETYEELEKLLLDRLCGRMHQAAEER